MAKALYIFTLKDTLYSRSELRSKRVAELKALIDYEKLVINKSEFEKFISAWNSKSTKVLKEECLSRGLITTGSKGMLALELSFSTNLPEPILDEDQIAVLNSEHTKLLVHAGPGAGKTTTLCELAKKYSDKRVLFLVYTKAICAEIIARIKRRGGVISNKEKIKYLTSTFVLTMDEYAAKRQVSISHGYRGSFIKSLEMGCQEWEQWDLLIVDEVQDVTDQYAPLLVQLEKVSERIVYAGDIRQSIYPGTDFIKGLVCPKLNLSYNYRSSKKIVNMLNVFSANYFGDDHIEQKCVTDKEGFVGTINIKDICHVLTNTSFVISPVSFEKYGTEVVANELRQRCSDVGKYLRVGNPIPDIATLSNAYRLKGCETDKGFLIQGDIDYDKLNVKRFDMAKLYFVSISRARNEFYFAHTSKHFSLLETHILDPIKELIGAKTIFDKSVFVCTPTTIEPNVEPICSFESVKFTPLVEVDESKFLNLFIKHSIAYNIGALKEDPFEAAKIKMSKEVGIEWTLGDKYKHLEINLRIENAKFMSLANRPIIPHRSKMVIGHAVSIVDFESETSVIGINTPINILAGWSFITGKKPILIETFEGEKKTFQFSDIKNKVRAGLLIKQATCAKVKNRHSYRLNLGTVMCVDIEELNGIILEIGAVAYNGRLIDVYHSVSPACQGEHYKRVDNFINVEILCGWKKIINPAIYHNDMLNDFKIWHSSLGECTNIQWAGSDDKILDIKCFDLRKPYMGLSGLKKGTTLTNAVERLIGPNIFEPHRAFEDALATLGVYITMN
jgi:hypothetical protein